MAWYRKLQAKLRALAQLGWRDSLRLTEAWLTLAWVDLVISAMPYKYWRGWLQARPATRAPLPTPLGDDIERIIRLAETAARNHLRPMNCLRRTLAQQKLLQRCAVQTSVHIGVRKAGAAVEAHAWLCWQGRVLNDTADVGERYAQLPLEQWAGISRFVD